MEEEFLAIEWTPKYPGDEPNHRRWDRSLQRMRLEVFARPIHGAVFIEGMEGILAEYQMLVAAKPDAFLYAVQAPGGAAAQLPLPSALEEELSASQLYPYLADLALEDLQRRRPTTG